MHSRLFTVAALFASGSFAAQNWLKLDDATVQAIRGLSIRQNDESFIPGTTPGFGNDCADAFGPGHLECADSGICYNPNEGQTCCDEGYPCPAGSFCLGAGKCCPDGLDPETCAEKLGVTLTSAAPVPTSSSSSVVPVPPAATNSQAGVVVTITTTICPTSSPSLPIVSIPNSTPSAGFPRFPSTTGVPVVPTSTNVPTSAPPSFDSGASIKNVASGTLALVALVGLVQNLL
ncbi:hypothetical protein VTO42DRAFT_8877 [Malbranchea cinnamomea]